MLEDIVQGAVDLFVRREAALTKGCYDGIETYLAIDVGILGLFINGVDDGAWGGMFTDVFSSGGKRHDGGQEVGVGF